METRRIGVQRVSATSSRGFDEVLSRLESQIGHPDMATFRSDITSARAFADLERVVNKATGESGLMEFTRFDLGEILRKELGEKAPRSIRLVVGNPLVMKQMVERVPDAGSYAPVTILIDERLDGVHLSYDRMASFLEPYQNGEALRIARDLDAKVESLLAAV